MIASENHWPRVGLFVTCLVELFRPGVGLAAVRLLEEAGCRVEVPMVQSCCGQPAYNSGDMADARAIARTVIRDFETFDHVVAPSGACAAMLKMRYRDLFEGDPVWEDRTADFCAKVHELTGFLVDVMKVSAITARVDGSVTYHDSCTGLAELEIRRQPRALLSRVAGLTVREMSGPGICCGLGGTCAGSETAPGKTDRIREAGAGTLLAGDLGCLLHIAGSLRREGSAIEVRHVAEVLAGMNDTPPIGGHIGRRATGRARTAARAREK